MKREMICIICPKGCRLQVQEEDGEIFVSGNICKKGKDFAVTEVTSPMRSVTTTVRTVFEDYPVLPVKTSGEIPKNCIFRLMAEAEKVVIDHNVSMGDVIIPNILGTECNLIATESLHKGEG